MYNSGNSSKNVTGASIVDGTIEDVDIASNAVGIDELKVTDGSAGQVLKTDGSGTLSFVDDTDTTYSVGDGGLTQVNFTTADNSKLDAIEALADVTDTTNVTASGALMDSEVTNLAQVKAFDTTDYVSKTSATGSALLPSGTTVQRDGTPVAGYLRWNSDETSAEVYDGTAWVAVGGGNATTEGLYEHANTISANYTITTGNNALTASPITINSGVSVTVPTGSTWVLA